jgi:protocatechuate 3,4-dioxygenase beta subunit
VAYPGRTPHIHLKVTRYGGATLTSQFYIAGDQQNERDFVYREAMRDPRQRDRIEMNLQPASGLEPGALATSMDIVVG